MDFEHILNLGVEKSIIIYRRIEIKIDVILL